MSNIFSSKSHFVHPNVVCPAPAVPAVPTFWSPVHSIIKAKTNVRPSTCLIPRDEIAEKVKDMLVNSKLNMLIRQVSVMALKMS
jgi:hypothetical protein